VNSHQRRKLCRLAERSGMRKNGKNVISYSELEFLRKANLSPRERLALAEDGVLDIDTTPAVSNMTKETTS
jgi:hypothetical protein